MNVEGMRIDLETALSDIRELNDREQALLHKLETVRQARKAHDDVVLHIAQAAEAGRLKPSEYRTLFGDLEAEIAAATTRASLSRQEYRS